MISSPSLNKVFYICYFLYYVKFKCYYSLQWLWYISDIYLLYFID